MAVIESSTDNEMFPVLPVAKIEQQSPEHKWLITHLWGREAVGFLGGHAKSSKSWLGLDMATSIASGTSCMDYFPVEQPGRTLIYLAEDSLPMVRSRIDGICSHRNIKIDNLDLFVITAPSIRLDTLNDQQRIKTTIEKYKPRMLLLDPLIRLHNSDENSSADMSRLLGFIRELQRTFNLAVVLVHHTGKKQRSHPGLTLRGSSDFYAWTDSNGFLLRKDKHLILTIEHRFAPSPDPFTLKLISRPDNSATHLEIISETPLLEQNPGSKNLADSVLEILDQSKIPLFRQAIRSNLKVNNQRLGHALCELEKRGIILRTRQGWQLAGPQNTNMKDDSQPGKQQCLQIANT